jgi:uncharacterized C2H2 Zn-finger protein
LALNKCINFTLEIFLLLLYEFQTCNAQRFIFIFNFLILVIYFFASRSIKMWYFYSCVKCMIIYSSRSTYIISLQLQFCRFENNLRTGAMVRHVNESLFWKYKWPKRKARFVESLITK